MAGNSIDHLNPHVARTSRGVVLVLALVTLTVSGFVATQPGGAATASTSYRLGGPATSALKTTLIKLFLATERRTHTLSAGAQVHLDNGIYSPATHAPAGYRNPVVVDGPGHHSWAYAKFIPVVSHTTLSDQVAMQDGGNIALFAASPTWHVLRIGVGYPSCVKSVLSKFVPAPVAALWLARRCQ